MFKKPKSRLNQDNQKILKFNVKKYKKHFPMLIIASIFFVLALYVVNHYYPAEIESFLIPHSYIAFLLPLFISLSFIFGYFLSSLKTGMMISISIVLLLLFKLNHFAINTYLLLYVFFLVIIIWLNLAFLRQFNTNNMPKKKSKKRKPKKSYGTSRRDWK